MSNLDQEIGKRLRKARKLCGYKSARAFAIEQKIPESTYSQHETGKRSLSPEIVLRYSECMNVDPGWLLSGREANKSFSTGATPVSEVSLYTSNRQAGKNAPMMIMDDLITVDMDIFKGVLREAIEKYAGFEMGSEKLEAFVGHCMQAYNTIANTPSDYPTKDGDTVASA